MIVLKVLAPLSVALSLLDYGCPGNNVDAIADQAIAVQEAVSQAVALESQFAEEEPLSPVLFRLAKIQGQADGLSLADMNIEDAVMLVMMLVTQDAENDLRQMIEEMGAQSKAKRAMREALKKARDEFARMKSRLAAEYEERSSDDTDTTVPVTEHHDLMIGASSLVASVMPHRGGDAVASMSCPQFKGEGTLAFIEFPSGAARATSTGPLGGISVAQTPRKGKGFAIQASSSVPAFCRLVLKYYAPESGPAGLSDEKIQSVLAARSALAGHFSGFHEELSRIDASGTIPSATLNELRALAIGMQNLTIPELSANELIALRDDLRDKLDTMNEMGEMQNLRVQMAIDRLSQFMKTLSDIMKKISAEQQSITQNLK